MKTIQMTYMLSDEQWARLDNIYKKLRKAGMFDGHSDEEMLRFKMDADQSHYIDCVLTALEQDYYRYFGDGISAGAVTGATIARAKLQTEFWRRYIRTKFLRRYIRGGGDGMTFAMKLAILAASLALFSYALAIGVIA